jgi:type IV pilus assembly protein PilN
VTPMIKINLLAEARAERVTKPPIISLGATNVNNYIILGLLVVGLAYVGFTYWRLNSTLQNVGAQVHAAQQEYERLKPIIAEVEEFKKKNAELKKKIDVIEQLKANQYGPVRIMDEVSKALPDLLWLTNMRLAGNSISLQGQAFNENAVANFIANLASSPFFSEPSLRIMQQTPQGIFTFDLSCTFNYAPAAPKPAGTKG